MTTTPQAAPSKAYERQRFEAWAQPILEDAVAATEFALAASQAVPAQEKTS